MQQSAPVETGVTNVRREKMFEKPEDFAAFGKGGLETAIKFAQISMDSAERMMKLQLDAARTSFEENSKTAKALADTKDPQQLMSLRTKLAEQSVEKMLSYCKSVYEVASATQAEVSRLLEQAMTSHSGEVMEAIEKVMKATPGAGSEAAVAAFKTAMSATQNAMESMTKAATQVTQMADSSIRAATQATSEAAKAAVKKK
ncbi:MAG: phasin family protein [Betaproteobacteria bacterium]|nr:phasin family protein [Betaproteobacteria bacterium]